MVNIRKYHIGFIIVLFILTVSVLIYGCSDIGMEKSIRDYKGDGSIKYLKAPLLGISGYAIEMPHFDLSKGINVEYNLKGIPKGRVHYILYLVVPEPCPLEKVMKGSCIFKIKKNEEVTTLSSIIKDMTNSQGNGKNQFYFYDKGYIDIADSDSKWSVAVSCENKFLDESVDAYILISSGGYK